MWHKIQLKECTGENDGLLIGKNGCHIRICLDGEIQLFEIDKRRSKCKQRLPRPCKFGDELYMPGQVIRIFRNKITVCVSGNFWKTIFVSGNMNDN